MADLNINSSVSEIQEAINRIETEIVQRTQEFWLDPIQLKINGYISTYGPIQIVCSPTEKYTLGILEDGTTNYNISAAGIIQELETDLSIINNVFEHNTNYDPIPDDDYDDDDIATLKSQKTETYQLLSEKQKYSWVNDFYYPIVNGFINQYQPVVFKTADGIEYVIDETADFSQASTITLTYTQPEPEVNDDTIIENETDEDLLSSNDNF